MSGPVSAKEMEYLQKQMNRAAEAAGKFNQKFDAAQRPAEAAEGVLPSQPPPKRKKVQKRTMGRKYDPTNVHFRKMEDKLERTDPNY